MLYSVKHREAGHRAIRYGNRQRMSDKKVSARESGRRRGRPVRCHVKRSRQPGVFTDRIAFVQSFFYFCNPAADDELGEKRPCFVIYGNLRLNCKSFFELNGYQNEILVN